MADGDGNGGNSTANGGAVEVEVEVEVELEVMRKGDFSWHPCKVSLCPSGVGLIVEYSNDNSDHPEDIILSTEEAVARLRVRSTPLESVACSTIQQGDRVLAKKNRANLFFDAEVIKVIRIRHSKKIHCRCTFMVKWIHNGLEGETAIIPYSALRRMSTESIHGHPTIFAFFNILLPSSCCDVSPLRALDEGMDCEVDVDELEKQIEQISNSADASRMKIKEKMLFEEVDLQEHSQCNPIAASEVHDAYIQLLPVLDGITGSTWQAQSNLPMEMEVTLPPPPSPFAQERFSESRSPSNPIAACAALASLMSKSSEITEILSAHKDVKGPPPNITDNPTAMKVARKITPQNISFTNDSSRISDEYSLGAEVTATASVPKYENVVKELFPTKKSIKDPQTLGSSAEVRKWESKSEKSSKEVASCVGRYVSPTTKKISLPTRSSSAVRRSSCENVEMPLTNARRFTRSMVRESKEKQTVETKNVSKEIQSATSEQNGSVQKGDLLPDKKTVASVIDNDPGLTISDKLKNQMGKRGICENSVSGMRTSGRGMQALNNSRGLTRSTVKGKSKKNNEEPYKGFGECRSLEHAKSDLEGNIASESNAPDMDKAISSSPVHEICPSPTAEEYKKVQLSASIKTAQKPEENATSNATPSQGKKRKSIAAKKQELRSSPRLRFLPRTRSQTKS